MDGAVLDEFFDVGSGGDHLCAAGTEQLVRTMTGGAGDRPRHSPHLPSELMGLGRHT